MGTDISTILNLTPSIPDFHSWPFTIAHSPNGLRYYGISDEAVFPVYGKAFWDAADRHLRALGVLLESRGCRFHPLLQGDFYDSSDLRTMWNNIKREERIIRSRGLEVRDIATGEQLLFKNTTYRAPWPGYVDFATDMGRMAQKGCAYVLIPEKLENRFGSWKEKKSNIENISVESLYDALQSSSSDSQPQSFRAFCVICETDSEKNRDKAWLAFTNSVFDLLKE